MRRHLVLPSRGVLLVNTDVHGNEEDFRRMETIFRESRAKEKETHWVILGDVVHAPDDVARRSLPALYNYPDGSMEIVDRIAALLEVYQGYVHFVLGNHDHGHVGGPHTHKFYSDEVANLETGIGARATARLRELFASALLAVAAPCGVLMTHGSPDQHFERLSDLDDAPLELGAMTPAQSSMIRGLLTSYGQPDAVCRAMLDNVGRSAGLDLEVVLHGHDRDEKGYFHEGTHQVCPCIFGAPRSEKRYVRLDLGARYARGTDLRDGTEILRLYQ